MSNDGSIDVRVATLEARMERAIQDLSDLDQKVDRMATKKDVQALQNFIEERDTAYFDHMFWIIKALVLILGAVLLTVLGGPKITDLLGLAR